jgi:hypothetical protein
MKLRLTNKGPCAVHTRRNAGGRPDVAVRDPACDRHPVDLWALARRPRPSMLVCRRALPVEDARARKQRRAGAHRHDVLQARIGLPDVRDRVQQSGRLRSRANAARDDEHVELLWWVLERVRWHDGLREIRIGSIVCGVERLLRQVDQYQDESFVVQLTLVDTGSSVEAMIARLIPCDPETMLRMSRGPKTSSAWKDGKTT